jgi:hypothetical protein
MTTASVATVEFRKSSYSLQGACVGVARPTEGPVLMRHTQEPDSIVLAFGRGEWRRFVAGLKATGFAGENHA